jgi:hypothetical protein
MVTTAPPRTDGHRPLLTATIGFLTGALLTRGQP